MKRGLTVTLVMVAIALSGYRAMGRAPVISNVPDIIIGDENSSTFPNLFVYPDVFNLNAKVDDPDGSDDQIIWSFYEPTGTYIINGVPSLADTTSASLVNPPNNRRIAGPGSGNPLDPADAQLRPYYPNIDTSAITPTFRNAHLSPIGGANTDPGASGIVGAETKVLTLFASDGSTVSQNPGALTGMMMVYTDNNGNDRTSPSQVTTKQSTHIHTWIFTTTYGFHTVAETGAVTFSQLSNSLCLEVPGPGDNRGEWASAYGSTTNGIDLVANSVYHARITGHTNQSSYNTVPMVMFLFENGSSAGDPSNNAAGAYTAEHVFLAADQQGGANEIGTRSWEVYYAPLAFRTPQWNSTTTGAFDPTWAQYINMRVRFRVFDYPTGWAGDQDLGQVCLDSIHLDRADYGDITQGDVVYTTTANLTGWRTQVSTNASDLTATAAGDGVTFAPSTTVGGVWTNQIVQYLPGDGSLGDFTAPFINDDYPVAWEANQLYQVDVEMSNPTPHAPYDQASDLVRVGMDVPTAEMAFMSGQSANLLGWGSPKATKATYTMFFYSHDVSLTPLATLRRLRPRMDFLNAADYSANGNTTGATDPIKVYTIKVTKVAYPADHP